ncbi:MAG: four helix bundle protein [Eubacteriales bacterium]
MKQTQIQTMSMDFAVRIVKLRKYLCKEKQEYEISKQLLRCGTSIGANAHEAEYGQSKKDVISKLSIALKEASETAYWLTLLRRTEYLSEEQFQSMLDDCTQIIKVLTAIVKTSKTDNY